MLMMLENNEPDDYVLSTGQAHSVKEFCTMAFDYAGLGDYKDYVKIDANFYRSAEVNVLLGDSSKAKEKLGWEHETSFEDLVKEMVDADMESISKGI